MERSTEPIMMHGVTGVRGGWLCDEMGMGVSCAVPCLVTHRDRAPG